MMGDEIKQDLIFTLPKGDGDLVIIKFEPVVAQKIWSELHEGCISKKKVQKLIELYYQILKDYVRYHKKAKIAFENGADAIESTMYELRGEVKLLIRVIEDLKKFIKGE
jgi:hypothetical protein